MSLICLRVGITFEKLQEIFAMILTWTHRLIGDTNMIERRFILDGNRGHHVMANSSMGWIQDHSCGLTQIGVQKLSGERQSLQVFLILSSQLLARSLIIEKDGRALVNVTE